MPLTDESYKKAIELIEQARNNGDLSLFLVNLGLTRLPPEIVKPIKIVYHKDVSNREAMNTVQKVSVMLNIG